MCSVDWNALGTWVVAVATAALVVVAMIAARYAYRAAIAANETLRLESEPALFAGIETESAAPNYKAAVQLLDRNRLAFMPTTTLGDVGTVIIGVRNVGRSAAMDVTVIIKAEDAEQKARVADFPWFVQSLMPGEQRTIGIHNATKTSVINIDVTGARKASALNGAAEEARLFKSAALPFWLG